MPDGWWVDCDGGESEDGKEKVKSQEDGGGGSGKRGRAADRAAEP